MSRVSTHNRSKPRKRVLIAGRGTAGRSLAEDVVSDGDTLVGYLDDLANHEDVLGKLADVAEISQRENIDVVYFAIPSAPAELVRDFLSRVPHPEVEFAVVPRTYRVVSREKVSVSDLTDIDVLDLVGRAPVKHDMLHARKAVAGRRVLVTGAAGSIGSRLVAQLQTLDPEAIVCVDRSEAGIFHLGQALAESTNIRYELADVQSETRIGQIMREYRPEIVFHVAAYKHVPLMQDNPIEAFNNNVWGTMNVLQQALAASVARVVYVSTDKAVNPTNVMGATKRIGELLLGDLAATSTVTSFSGVRFGNVLESEGSVMQTFRRQLQRRQNLTVTHRDITRYFMTIDEAAQLVIQTATTGRQGDLFVLDMGEPIRVFDLAEGLIAAIDPSLEVDIIGLRPGEKMFEELSYQASSVDSTTHPKIFIVTEHSEHDRGVALDWARGLVDRTRLYDISADELQNELRAFGFTSLQ